VDLDKLVVAAELDNEIEAQVLADILDEKRIPHIIRRFANDYYGMIFQLGQGWGQVLAPSLHKEEIERILAELREENID